MRRLVPHLLSGASLATLVALTACGGTAAPAAGSGSSTGAAPVSSSVAASPAAAQPASASAASSAASANPAPSSGGAAVSPATSVAGGAPAKVFHVGITQILSHPILDAVKKGFMEEVIQKGGLVDGKTIVFDQQNAQNDQTLAKTIADKFVADKVDLIFAISTPAMQAAYKSAHPANIPVIFDAVSDPVGAGVMTTVDQPSGTDITGVYNFDPVQAQMDLAAQLKPGVKTIGAIYNPGESNSVSNIKVLKSVAAQRGWKVVDATVNSTADVLSASQSLVGRVDVAYMPTDNTVQSGLEALVKVTQGAKLPLITGDSNSVKSGGLGAVGDDAEDKGRQAGDMAISVLKDGKSVGTIKPERVRKRILFLNQTTAKIDGITLTPDILKGATVYK